MVDRSFEPGIEVTGITMNVIIDGFQLFPSVVAKFLRQQRLISDNPAAPYSMPVVDPNAWYPLDAWLRAFEAIAQEVGRSTLYNVGRQVPKHAVFPPTVRDITSALESLDVAYHMNHRKNGRVMFNPATGVMLEGIGHFRYRRDGDRKITIACDTPYPCEFDRGIVVAMATKFEPKAKIAHPDGTLCRQTGANSCTLEITW